MTSPLRKLFITGTLCLSSLFATGCWDYEKINDRAQIIGIAVDPIPEQPQMLSFTIQVPQFEQGGGQQGGGQQGGSPSQSGSTATFKNFVATAHGLSEAIAKAQTRYEKMFYLGNVQSIVLSQRLSTEQVRHVITEFIRIPSLDKLAWVLVTPQSAQEIFNAPTTVAPADTIDRVLGGNLKQHGLTIRTRLWEFWRDAEAVGIQPHTGLVRTTGKGIQVYGMIVFDHLGPRMELPPNDTLYFNFVNDKVERVAMWVQDKTRSFEVGDVRSRAKLSTTVQGNTPILHARIRVTGIIEQDETDGTVPLTDAEMRRYEAVMEKQIQDQGSRVLRQFQENKVDAYGFGEHFFVHRPASRQFVQQHWPDTFSRAKPDFQVKVRLLRKGTLM